jgi:hypothetical protein
LIKSNLQASFEKARTLNTAVSMSKALQQYATEVTNGVACDSEGPGGMIFAKRRELHEVTAIILSHRKIGTAGLPGLLELRYHRWVLSWCMRVAQVSLYLSFMQIDPLFASAM